MIDIVCDYYAHRINTTECGKFNNIMTISDNETKIQVSILLASITLTSSNQNFNGDTKNKTNYIYKKYW